MTSRVAAYLNFARQRTVKPGGVKYGHITYFPKHPNDVDPPFTPSKLLLVKRVKPFAGNPYWEKDILSKCLGLKEKSSDPVIVKNTPEMCAMLWRVKHLVKITPIKLPDKLPTPDDLNGTYLHENGTFYVVPKVESVRVKAREEYTNNPKKLNRTIIQDKIREKWLEGGDL